MITKELLKEIFKDKWKKYQPNPNPEYKNVPFTIDKIEKYSFDNLTIVNTMILISGTARDNRSWDMEINMYELVYLCKIWASEKCYYMTIDTRPEETSIIQVVRYGDRIFYEKFNGKSEPEAIFDACEWIRQKETT
jgi:hypothetical protein